MQLEGELPPVGEIQAADLEVKITLRLADVPPGTADQTLSAFAHWMERVTAPGSATFTVNSAVLVPSRES